MSTDNVIVLPYEPAQPVHCDECQDGTEDCQECGGRGIVSVPVNTGLKWASALCERCDGLGVVLCWNCKGGL